MKDNVMLTIASLLSIVLTTFHIASDVQLGYETARPQLLNIAPILVVFLIGATLLAGRRSGYIIILLGSLGGLYVPYLHMGGRRIGEVAMSSGGYFFIWTLIVLATTSLFSVILALLGLWRLQRGKPSSPQP